MNQNYILGGYTQRKGQGLYSVHFDSSSCQFDEPELVETLTDSTYVDLDDTRNYLFSIHRDEGRGGVIAFQRQADNSWKEVDRLAYADDIGCHIFYRPKTKTLYISNCILGQLDVILFDNDELTHLQSLQFEGSGPLPGQESSHIHYAQVNRTNTQLYVCDLGTDSVQVFHIRPDGRLDLSETVPMPAGSGPRHLVSHPFLEQMYVIGELSNKTYRLGLNAFNKIEVKQELLNIPEEMVPTSNGAAIRITADGRFLYTTTRYYDVITAFALDEDGIMTKLEEMNTIGKNPRDFVLDEEEQFLLVVHQDSDYLSVFKRDIETGRLTFENNETKAPECVCIRRI